MASHGVPGRHRDWKGMSEWEMEEKRAEVRRLLRCEDITIVEIATSTGYSSRQVDRIARKMGIPPKFRKTTEVEKDRIRELGHQGLSMTEIRWRLRGGDSGPRVTTIAKILDEAGIPRRHKGEVWAGDSHFGKVCKGNVK